MNTVRIELNGNAGSVAGIELCADGVCAASAPVQQVPDEPLRLATVIPKDSATSAPAPTDIPLLFSISRIDERTWQISLDMATPERLTLRAVSATGEVLAERDVALEWRRVGGSEQCGGPSDAGPVSLDIPG